MDGRKRGKEVEDVSQMADNYWKKLEGLDDAKQSIWQGSIIHRLGWELVRTQRDPDSMENTIVSPISAVLLLELALAAVDLNGETEWSQTVKDIAPTRIEVSLATLIHTLDASTINGAPTQHNACFGSKDVTLYDYLERVVGAKTDCTLSDSATTIANWMMECMHVRDSTAKTPLLANLRQIYLDLTSSLVLKSSWSRAFLADATASENQFTISPRQSRQVEMISASRISVETSYGENYIAVRLPYTCTSPSPSYEAPGHTCLSVVAYLPDPTVSVQEVIAQIQRSSDALHFRPKVYERFGFPKFTVETGALLEQLLRQSGYLVQGAYPLIGKIGRIKDYSTQAHHGYCRKVGKRSDHAANTASMAATRGRGGAKMLRPRPTLIIDRPFAFSIQSENSQTVLFTGVFMGR